MTVDVTTYATPSELFVLMAIGTRNDTTENAALHRFVEEPARPLEQPGLKTSIAPHNGTLG